MESQKIHRKLRAEADRLSDLRARQLIAQNELAKLDKSRGTAAYVAQTKKDEKSRADFEEIKKQRKQKEAEIEEIDLAVVICEEKIAGHRREYEDAYDEETWQERVVRPMEQEIAVTAKQIEARFRGKPNKEELPPIDEQLNTHKEILGRVSSELMRRQMTTYINLARFCTDWVDYAMKPSKVRYPHPGYREELAGSYVALLQKRFNVFLKQRAEVVKPQIAVNDR